MRFAILSTQDNDMENEDNERDQNVPNNKNVDGVITMTIENILSRTNATQPHPIPDLIQDNLAAPTKNKTQLITYELNQKPFELPRQNYQNPNPAPTKSTNHK
ncbi:uncharacterized protein DS421_1g32600 [Arachis hypogaea]|nr:uncharacterized protein DS421_1g32600 [Arachis hypogaea]